MANKTETRGITMKELAQVFEGKYVNVESIDHYGIAIEVRKGTIEYENNFEPELWFVSRDSENRVTGSVAITEDIIENIEGCDDGYIISFNIYMAAIDISEYKSLEQLQKERDEKQKV